MWSPIRLTSGHPVAERASSSAGRVPRVLTVLTALAAVTATGCNYSFSAGQGFPEHVNTIAVIPFENETARFDLTTEIFTALQSELPRALGIRVGAEETADAVVRGTIISYTLGAPLYRTSEGADRAQVLQREVQISVQVEILDVQENMILWENQRLVGQAAYIEGVESEELGRALAIELLVQSVVDGAQSNW